MNHTVRSPPRRVVSHSTQQYSSQGSRLVRIDPAEVAIPSIESDSLLSKSARRPRVGGNEAYESMVPMSPRHMMSAPTHRINDLSKEVEVIRLTSDWPSNSTKRGLTDAFPEVGRYSERPNKVSRYAAFANHDQGSIQSSDSNVIDLTSPSRRRLPEGRVAGEPSSSHIRGYHSPPRMVQTTPIQNSSPTSFRFPRGAHKQNPFFLDGANDTIMYRRTEMPIVANEPLPLPRYTEYRSPERAKPARLDIQPQELTTTAMRHPSDYVIRERPSSSIVSVREDFDRR